MLLMLWKYLPDVDIDPMGLVVCLDLFRGVIVVW